MMATYIVRENPDEPPFRRCTLERVEEEQSCAYAKQFVAWRDTVCQKALASSNVILLNQTRLKVANRYYEFYVSVPEYHKHCLGNGDHLCIFSVFIETMHKLREHELNIDPPLLFEPPPPPPPPVIEVVEIDGPRLGEFIRR